MKYPSLLGIVISCTALFTECRAIETETVSPAILSFGAVDQKGQTHVGAIDNEFKTVRINTISSPEEVTEVKFRLTPNTSISPDPVGLVGNCLKNNKFTLTSGNQEELWHVLFPEFGKDEEDDSGKQWVLEWEENFDGTRFDEKTWSKTPEGNPDWCTQMAMYDDLFEVKDGILTLWGKKNDNHPEDVRTSLTGGLWTRDLRAFKDGRLVVRVRHDKARGFWPAVWLRPQDGPDEYSEIDIVELVKGQVHQTIHTDYTIANKGKPDLGNTISMTTDDFEGWHEYSVEIQKDKVILGMDGKTTLTYSRRKDLKPGDPQQFPFHDRSFYLILSAQLGGKWAGKVYLEDLPCRLQIDYVRYYRFR